MVVCGRRVERNQSLEAYAKARLIGELEFRRLLYAKVDSRNQNDVILIEKSDFALLPSIVVYDDSRPTRL